MAHEQQGVEDPALEGRRENRAFFRVSARLAARCRKLDDWELDSVRREITGLRDAPRLDIDPRLAAWLERIEHKLELLLAYTNQRRRGPVPEAEVQAVVISGSGVMLDTRERVNLGDEVLLEIPIPGARVQPVRALGRVVRIETGLAIPGGRSVALSYTTIDEVDREAIVRFAHEVQRGRIDALPHKSNA